MPWIVSFGEEPVDVLITISEIPTALQFCMPNHIALVRSLKPNVNIIYFSLPHGIPPVLPAGESIKKNNQPRIVFGNAYVASLTSLSRYRSPRLTLTCSASAR
jgi:hypothetical protein